MCLSWRGTPWLAGQRCKGAGVDCVRFAAAVWDELAGLPPTPLPRLAQDSGLHRMAERQAAITLRAFALVHPVDPLDISEVDLEPADMLVMRLGCRGGPGHVMVVGQSEHSVYHADTTRGVHRRCLPPAADILHVWRARNRDTWPLS